MNNTTVSAIYVLLSNGSLVFLCGFKSDILDVWQGIGFLSTDAVTDGVQHLLIRIAQVVFTKIRL